MGEEICEEKENANGDIKKIEFDASQRESIIKISQIIKKIIEEDNGNYIINCLDGAVGDKPNVIIFNNLLKSFEYNYTNDVVNFLLTILISPPFYTYELKDVVKDDVVNDFIDEIQKKYSSEIKKLYKCRIGNTDWQYIRSNPIIREDGVALSNEIILVNEEVINFTSSLKSLPKLTSHFLKHINRTIDFLKERAFIEISMDDLNVITAQMTELVGRIETFEKTKAKEEKSDEKDIMTK